MTQTGRMMAGGGAKGRQKHDFYPTPPEATEKLLEALPLQNWPHDVWEPACGDGACAKVLATRFRSVIASDLIDLGYGSAPVDFLATRHLEAAALITNPPFALAQRFIEHAFDLGVTHLALLLSASYWHAGKRVPLYRQFPFTRELPVAWRLDFMNLGRPAMNTTWFVWEPNAKGAFFFNPLTRTAIRRTNATKRK